MKKVLKITANVLVWIILILALLITIMVFSSGRNNGISNLLGYIPMTVESDSMKPTFKKNDLIICKEVDDVYSLKKGDVITFWTIIDGKKVKIPTVSLKSTNLKTPEASLHEAITTTRMIQCLHTQVMLSASGQM